MMCLSRRWCTMNSRLWSHKFIVFAQFIETGWFFCGAGLTMMAPSLNVVDRTTTTTTNTAHDPLLISISSEDDTILGNQNADSSDKTPNTNSQCSSMSDGESYECYGEGEVDSPPISQPG
ncbi:hypothetical protein V9T40_010829 [Parthenolecanium corni]|uniref:Uncharacterized protein n=1 Tax=Parthenolecanium corni TaxID=536013 RepID=A0AAN9T4B6_9HEMI